MNNQKNYNISFIIIILNTIIYFASLLLFEHLNTYLALHPTLFIKYKHYWTPITYMFAHGSFSHLFFNMFGLFVFGHSIEEKMGSLSFSIYYFIIGTLAGISSLVIYKLLNIEVFLIGASGAIYAVLFAYAVFYPTRKIYIWGILPIKTPVLILIYTVIDLYSQVFRSTNIAHITHLLGFAFAFFYFKIIYRINPIFVFRNFKRFTN